MEKYLDQGHILFIDNWYTSPNLLDLILYQNKTGACGTVRTNRVGLPQVRRKDKSQKGKKVSKGTVQWQHTDTLLFIRWQDKREVTMLSTIHENTIMETNKIDQITGHPIRKPTMVIDYNSNIGLVDKSDMMLSSTECARKTTKWYKKMFFHVLDLMMYNAYVMYKSKFQFKCGLSSFKLAVLEELFNRTGSAKNRRSAQSVSSNILRLEGKDVSHFPTHTGSDKRCFICLSHQIRSMTRFQCTICNVALCISK